MIRLKMKNKICVKLIINLIVVIIYLKKKIKSIHILIGKIIITYIYIYIYLVLISLSIFFFYLKQILNDYFHLCYY